MDAINRIMDPDTIADITLREGIYEFDPDLEGYTRKKINWFL